MFHTHSEVFLMKLLRIATIVLIILIVTTMTTTIILTQKYSSYEGKIEGTGFVDQELWRVGGVRFDVDDDGNIYFAVYTPSDDGIVIYNKEGDYIYTLPIEASGAISVKIDEDNNILVYNTRKDIVTKYDQKGFQITKVQAEDHSLGNSFPWLSTDNVRERNDIKYFNTDGTIIKEENGMKTVVFTVPTWQRWNSALSLIMILSIVALFLRIAISLWIKAYKKRYG